MKQVYRKVIDKVRRRRVIRPFGDGLQTTSLEPRSELRAGLKASTTEIYIAMENLKRHIDETR